MYTAAWSGRAHSDTRPSLQDGVRDYLLYQIYEKSNVCVSKAATLGSSFDLTLTVLILLVLAILDASCVLQFSKLHSKKVHDDCDAGKCLVYSPFVRTHFLPVHSPSKSSSFLLSCFFGFKSW